MTAGSSLVIADNPRRVRLEVVASYYNTFRGTVYIDSVSGGKPAGKVSDTYAYGFVLDSESSGDLCQRRFVLRRLTGGSPESIGVIETELVDSRVSGY